MRVQTAWVHHKMGDDQLAPCDVRTRDYGSGTMAAPNTRLHPGGRSSLLRKPFICAPATITARLNVALPVRHVARG